MSAAFSGLNVVELSDRLSGAFAARLFGDFGAAVTLVESPDGHALRHERPFLTDTPGVERGVQHGYVNWNKRSCVVTTDDALAALVAAGVTGTLDNT